MWIGQQIFSGGEQGELLTNFVPAGSIVSPSIDLDVTIKRSSRGGLMKILGISAYYHDSAAALVCSGVPLAAAQEERFSRRRHDARFPWHAVDYCLMESGVSLTELDYIVFYDKPLLKFERLLETYLSYAPAGFSSFATAMPIWLKEKLFLKVLLRRELCRVGRCEEAHLPPLLFTAHHQSHAASAFFPSPFQRAAVLCMDGVGEWATTSVWLGEGNSLSPRWEIDFPHSLGLLYSAFTHFAGFRVNSGEYKLMGLAPYGTPRYVELIMDRLLSLKADGSFRLDMRYFDYAHGLAMTNRHFHELFGGDPRQPESPIGQREMDIARSVQVVTEEVVMRLARTAQRETDADCLCLAGGVALNCVSNGRLMREGPFREVWIQPAAGDAGGALGAALSAWHEYLDGPRAAPVSDSMQGALLGPRYPERQIGEYLDSVNARYVRMDDGELLPRTADILAAGGVVGWFQGRMEFGPRALGNRSILADPRNEEMQSVINFKIKRRESFRPFAPSVLAERVSDWFEIDRSSPYMLVTAPVAGHLRRPATEEETALIGLERLTLPWSAIPAVTHVDYSARIQTVDRDANPRYHALLERFEERAGCPLLVNTSFNIRGEPIVCSPADAYRCFMNTELDYLVIENFLLAKSDQPPWREDGVATSGFRAGSGGHDVNTVTEPGPKRLREFALVIGGMVAVLFGLLLPWLAGHSFPAWPWIIAAILSVLGLAVPMSLQTIHRLWLKLGLLLSRATTPLILGVVFYLMITPMALIMRLFGRDPLSRRWDSSVESYRVAAGQPPRSQMEKPF